MAADREAFADSVEPIIKAVLSEIVESNYQIDENLNLRLTIGHTPGHVSVEIKSKKQKAMISGDFIHHPLQLAYPFWKMDADVLPDQAVKTRIDLLEELANSDTFLIGSHFSNPVAGFVVKQGESFVFNV